MAGPRRFDHDEALRLFNQGVKISALALHFGVTDGAIRRVVDDEYRERQNENHRIHRTGPCEMCGGPCLKATHPARHSQDGRQLCARCRGIERRTSVRLSRSGSVRTVKCVGCHRWLSPDRFGRGSRFSDLREGGFHGSCRECLTLQKRAYREAHRAPCSHGCGRMVNLVDRRDRTKPLECRSCAARRVALVLNAARSRSRG